MRKTIILASLILSGLMILDSLNVGEALIMFLLAGQIPGTNLSLSGGAMLELFALAGGFTLARIATKAIRSHETSHRLFRSIERA